MLEKSKISQLYLKVTLITDGLTNKKLIEYYSVACCVTDINFNREIIVLGLEMMSGKSNSENIGFVIESLVNEYVFNKSLISGK